MSMQRAPNARSLTPPDTPASGLRGIPKFQTQHNTPRIGFTIGDSSPPITPEQYPVESFASREEDCDVNPTSTEESIEPQQPAAQDPTLFEGPTSLKPAPSQAESLLHQSRAPNPRFKQKIRQLFENFIILARKTLGRPSEAKVQRALKLIEDVRLGRYMNDKYPKVALTAAEYRALRREILESSDRELKGYFEHKLRYEYKRTKKQFQIRMPTVIHEVAVGLVQEKWAVWKDNLKKSKDLPQYVTAAAASMISTGAANVPMDYSLGEADTASPDWSCSHRICTQNCNSASIVLEVAWTQTKSELHTKAERYISSSRTQVRTVIGLNLHDMYRAELRNQKHKYSDEYEMETGEAKFTVWRRVTRATGGGNRNYAKIVVPEQTFRNKQGTAIPSVALRVPLKDFICSGSNLGTLGKGPRIEELVISSEELCEDISYGLKQYRAWKKKQWEDEGLGLENEGLENEGLENEGLENEGLEQEQRNQNLRSKQSSKAASKEKSRKDKKAENEPASRKSMRLLERLFTGNDGRRHSPRLFKRMSNNI